MAAKPTYKLVSTDQTYADYARNFRMGSSYAECEPIKGFDPDKHKANLYEDIVQHGIHTPLAVVELDKEEAVRLSELTGRTIKFRILRGHRRFKVVENVRVTQPHMFETIPANVYSGLTKDDEFRLMVDHVHVKSLNDFELYDAICKLAKNTRLSEEAIGLHVGRSRGYVQRRKWIMSLPACVEENYRKRFETDEDGKTVPHIRFTDPDLVKLNAAAGVDRTKGIEPGTDGSEFGKVWDTIVTSGSTRGMEPKAMTRKEILDRVQYIKDPIMKHIMRAIAGDPLNLSDAEDMLSALRSEVKV